VSEGKLNRSFEFFIDLEEYLTEEFEVGLTAQLFIEKHCSKFINLNLEDIPICCYQAFEEYQKIFENKLEKFCSLRDVGKQLFVEWCTAAVQGASENEGGNKEFLEILLAADSFEVFCNLMVTTVKQMELQNLLNETESQKEEDKNYQGKKK
jgi:hypothetical protein